MKVKKSEIFSLSFHNKLCTTGFIHVQKNSGWLIKIGRNKNRTEGLFCQARFVLLLLMVLSS